MSVLPDKMTLCDIFGSSKSKKFEEFDYQAFLHDKNPSAKKLIVVLRHFKNHLTRIPKQTS